MAGISPKTVPLMLIVTCTAVLVPAGLAQLIPGPFPPIPGLLPGPELEKCWAALTSTPGCLMEIYGSFFSGQIGKIGPVCCASIVQVSEDCWPKMFPLNPLFPPLLKTACAAAPSPKAVGANAISEVSLQGIVKVTELVECWSTFAGIEGCSLEVYKSVLNSGNIGGIGPACCKAVTEINDKCWPKMFPFNPFFPPLLKSTCARVTGAAPPAVKD
ncbi:hypothetical protein ACOSP7_008450 [Xanthoceras sorbifolium]